MVETTERKTPEEIKQKILEVLNDKPLNALEISKAIGSNWSTVKTYIADLIEEKKVKEIIFNGQIIYLKLTEDTYFNIPIKEEERKLFKFIFYNAIQKYKEITGKQIRRTELAKLCAEITTELKLQIPIVWYIYGPMPLMIIDIQKNYTTDFVPDNSQEIKKAIERWIRNSTKNLIRELRVEYYQKSKNEVYVVKEEIYWKLEKKDYNNLSDLFFNFLTSIVAYNKGFEQIVSPLYRIVSGAEYIKLLENKEFHSKLFLTFDCVWKYIAIHMLVDSLIKIGYPLSEKDLLLGQIIDTKNSFAMESINELNEFYMEHIPEKIPTPKFETINLEARKIIDQWTDSEVWRE
ncbi:MAG: hypothetical protein AABW47_04045 [Nanoarchaeota archaeon]